MEWADFDNTVAIAVLLLHLLWILWVIFGALWTSGRRWLMAFHIASLLWGIAVEVGPWACPLTVAEDFFQRRACLAPYPGSFLLHCINSLVYPNVSVTLLTVCGVAVCAANLGIYAWRVFKKQRRNRSQAHLP